MPLPAAGIKIMDITTEGVLRQPPLASLAYPCAAEVEEKKASLSWVCLSGLVHGAHRGGPDGS